MDVLGLVAHDSCQNYLEIRPNDWGSLRQSEEMRNSLRISTPGRETVALPFHVAGANRFTPMKSLRLSNLVAELSTNHAYCHTMI